MKTKLYNSEILIGKKKVHFVQVSWWTCKACAYLFKPCDIHVGKQPTRAWTMCHWETERPITKSTNSAKKVTCKHCRRAIDKMTDKFRGFLDQSRRSKLKEK